MISYINHLLEAKDLLRAWTERIIRARYQQSILGGLWIVIQPLATVAMFSTIFTLFIPVDTGSVPYPVFSYVALTPWMLLVSSLGDMTESVVGNMQLVTKIYFPREILPLSSLLARLLDFLIAFTLILFMMLAYKLPLFQLTWMFLPAILMVQLILIIGLGLLLAAANVFYRDIRSLLTLGTQLWFYGSPIIYPVELVPAHLRFFYYLNPMSGILEAYRTVLLHNSYPGFPFLLSSIMAAAVFLSGIWFFKRVEFQFADIV